ncbi:sensor histidine kinase [Sphingobacterium faecium]|jgi:two-component system phosphate regulon sensor histidine kinase PhoR|uniref:sensor histidine kinase n=1 Tax=Sphingobacterium faecium TaxID=34087 RepID=UPI00097F5891|nr:HAMP domain-containing sensor histidine kinase [Sphingobacterium faecium]WGQ16536.1 HAMP domain-containing sensor histidine kinase [Sphingobacterium faecium]SJN24168.1 two-component regulatory system, sensor kinase protein [Sphingobacterium faecium PCAi_F2.5]
MKKSSIVLIISLMTLALLGVAAMQFYFIRESYRQKSQLFDESVNASLTAVAGKIERREVIDFAKVQQQTNIKKYQFEQEKQRHLAEQLKLQRELENLRAEQYAIKEKFKEAEDQLKETFPSVISIENSFYETYINRKNKENVLSIDVIKYNSPDHVVKEYVEIGATKFLPRVNAKDDSARFVIPTIDPVLKQAIEYKIATLPPRSNKQISKKIIELEDQLENMSGQNLIGNGKNVFDTIAAIGGKRSGIIEDVAIGMELSKRPFRERLNINLIQNLLKEELSERDIHYPFNIEVRDSSNIVFRIQTIDNIIKPNKITRYSTALFKGDIGSPPGILSVYFPRKSTIIVDNMSYLLLPTLALLFLLIGCFAYTLLIIFKQKKVSEMKTDFINNMTHEFKTPVATIMIASESLRDPEIISDERRVKRLANIIYDENVRLGNHIERVLDIARLEKETLKLEKTPIHINDLLSAVLDSMQLQLQKVGGKFEHHFDAKNDVVVGDELHLSNVFFNLVDNAIKYSKDNPHITVKTKNTKDSIHITIIDNGIGMAKDHLLKIFDQFYRIPTGNVHNVKGFGLGLSYVYDIIKRMNGKIQVKSDKDKGTQFDIVLPIKN